MLKNKVSKFELTEDEMNLLLNPDWILKKRRIIEKVNTMLAEQIPIFKELITARGKAIATAEILCVSPKISKGENYLGLPYLILDYPRCFDKHNVFAIRTMFWWGKYFSISLHLQGRFKTQYNKRLKKSFDALVKSDFFISTASTPYEFEFTKKNFLKIKNLSSPEFDNIIESKDFIKISVKRNFTDWQNIPDWMKTKYETILSLLAT